MVQQISPERRLGVGILSGTVAGLIVGIGARVIMRIVALAANRPPEFTIEGSLGIILMGTFVGLFLGLLTGALCIPFFESPRTRRYVPGPILRGLLVSTILFLIFGLPDFLNFSPDNDLSIGPPYLGRSLFGALFIIFGITMGLTEILFHRYLPRKSASTEPPVPKPDRE